MTLLRFLLLSSILFVVDQANAEGLLVISDIDDTIKISHARDTSSAVSNLQNNDSFLGMKEIYNELFRQTLIDSGSKCNFQKNYFDW